MPIYIHGMGNISPQKTWGDDGLLSEPLNYSENRLRCVEPDYSDFIDAKQIRRMSRIIKMGVASAAMALKESGISIPDGVITATGYGCLDDTGTFLTKMVENKEQAVNPTPFIQSTHNTIGSQIALLLQCLGYNQTYTQRGLSFENALIDCHLQVSENPGKNFLLGAIDEITDISHSIESRFGIFSREIKGSLSLLKQKQKGTLNGEGSAFFVVSGEPVKALVSINAIKTLYKPDGRHLQSAFEKFRNQCGGADLILSGKCGDDASDHLLNETIRILDEETPVGFFKHLCGEHPVSSAFACWLGARILQIQTIPEIVSSLKKKPLKNIIIFNQYLGTHYSLIHLSTC